MVKKMKIMKRNLFLLLPLFALIVLGEACSTKNDPIPAPTPPFGTFSGTFKLLVRKANSSAYDTVKKDPLFSVTLSQPNKFVVTRSTSTIHALSRGSFQYNGQLIGFTDSTYVPGPQPLTRLIGVYQVGVNATRLQFIRPNNNSTQDSVWFYDLYKAAN
ncbi:hypothetical protein [Mucilaginibacter sp. SG564]|uniref:hypothetical protein n=1 Tax=Mucilaginibacter sp. SG564 TaxID=2587022 RepID=UPI001553BE56|nr:hypothetical protein [Mucilaginibacter sp. SG564]